MNKKRELIITSLILIAFIGNFVSAEWGGNLNEGLISYWSFDEIKGNILEDLVEGKYNGTHNAGGSSGILNYSGDYSGASNVETTIAGSPAFDGTSMTYAFWFYHHNVGGGVSEWIINRKEGGSGDSFIFNEETGSTTYRCNYNIGGVEGAPPGYNTWGANKWVFIACAWNGTDVLMYVNGSLHSTTSLSKASFSSSHPLVIGTKADNTQNYDGLLDELGIWNRSLSAEEISQLYNNGLGISYSSYIDSTYPLFSNFLNPQKSYSPNQTYFFNASINSTNGTAGIEFDGKNYSIQNHSDFFYWNISDLSAGNYPYHWWAYGNGINNLFNSSEKHVFTILKKESALSLLIDGVSENKTIDNQTNIELKANLSDGEGKIQLWVNKNLLSEESNSLKKILNFSEISMHELTVIYLGNENFTSSNKTLWLNVTKYIFYKEPIKKSSSRGGIREISDYELPQKEKDSKSDLITTKTILQNKKEEKNQLQKIIRELFEMILQIISKLMGMFK